MEDQKVKTVAAQTEVPVTNLHSNESKRKLFLLEFNKKLLIGVALVVVLLIISIGYLLTNSKQSRFTEADVAYQKGNFNEAKNLYIKAGNKNPSDAGINAAIINSIASQGNQTGQEQKALKEAMPYIEKSLKTSPDNFDVLLSIGYSYETAGEYDKALEYYDKALAIYPQSSIALFHRGHVLQFLNRISEANEEYKKAISLNPNDPYALMGMANSYFANGDLQLSFETFKKAAEMSTENQTKAEALTGASIVRRDQENFKYMYEAFQLSKQAVEYSPNFSPALGTYGFNLALTNEQEKGIEFLKKAISANSRISRNYYQLSLVYRVRKDYSQAVSYNQEAINHVADDNTLVGQSDKNIAKGKYLYELAKTYVISGSNIDVMPLLKEAVSLNPQVVSLLKLDTKNVNFNSLNSNPEFVALIQ